MEETGLSADRVVSANLVCFRVRNSTVATPLANITRTYALALLARKRKCNFTIMYCGSHWPLSSCPSGDYDSWPCASSRLLIGMHRVYTSKPISRRLRWRSASVSHSFTYNIQTNGRNVRCFRSLMTSGASASNCLHRPMVLVRPTRPNRCILEVHSRASLFQIVARRVT